MFNTYAPQDPGPFRYQYARHTVHIVQAGSADYLEKKVNERLASVIDSGQSQDVQVNVFSPTLAVITVMDKYVQEDGADPIKYLDFARAQHAAQQAQYLDYVVAQQVPATEPEAEETSPQREPLAFTPRPAVAPKPKPEVDEGEKGTEDGSSEEPIVGDAATEGAGAGEEPRGEDASA